MTGQGSIEAGLTTVAGIHTTVDLERALEEHDRPAADAATALAEPLLGARVVVIEAGAGADDLLAIAEPITEGRLAATLARHGEGVVGRYAALPEGEDLAAFRRRAASAGTAITRVERGPFGPEVLVLGGPVTGPHLIVVERRPLPSDS